MKLCKALFIIALTPILLRAAQDAPVQLLRIIPESDLLQTSWWQKPHPIALHEAVLSGDFSGVIFLLNQGANIDEQDSNGNTALTNLCRLTDLDLVKQVIVKLPADANPTNGEFEQLCSILMNRYNAIASILLAYGANTEITNNNGQKAIDIAKENGWGEFIESFAPQAAPENNAVVTHTSQATPFTESHTVGGILDAAIQKMSELPIVHAVKPSVEASINTVEETVTNAIAQLDTVIPDVPATVQVPNPFTNDQADTPTYSCLGVNLDCAVQATKDFGAAALKEIKNVYAKVQARLFS